MADTSYGANVSSPTNLSSSNGVVDIGMGSFSVYYLISAVVLSLVGSVGNSLFILSLWREKKLRTTSNYLLAHLSAVDLLNCMVTIPLTTLLTWVRIPVTACFIGYIVYPLFPVMSMYSQFYIAVNRFCLVSKSPSEYQELFNTKRSLIGGLVGWCLHGTEAIVLIATMLPPIYPGTYICYSTRVIPEALDALFYRLYGFSIFYFCCSILFYIKLRLYVRSNALHLTVAKRRDTDISSTLLRICIMSISSALLPPIVVFLAIQLNVKSDSLEMVVLQELGSVLFFLSYVVNPLLYGYKVKLFRDTVRRMFSFSRRNRTAPLPN